MKPKVLVILGPTASGKSDLAVELALKLNGEVISADSRQVYKGLDIGTGKITAAEMKSVRHWCLDIADPKERFTAMDWKKAAETAVADIVSRGKLPIICGGTGFYISALIDDLGFPDVKADTEEQKALESKTAEELFEELKKLDPNRAATIDLKNKRRMARAILIARELGAVPPIAQPAEPKYDAIIIGVAIPDHVLRDRIRDRLTKRLDAGMIKEVEQLHENGLSYERMDELGLEYRYLAQYLEGKIAREPMIELLLTRIWQYARRQKTWFKRDARIRWFEQPVNLAEISALTADLLHYTRI
ncbi:MAG: tRNA (adenosine(37)-N6)-dimethylallyltransferase MiaA [Minisyncoccia bacterium]|jgi:tRNA dimethylallyltransferase